MQKIIIIAEAGINHNGSIKKAFQLVDIAKKANADFVKFQTYKTNNLVLPNAKKAKYQIGKSNENQFQMLKKSELSYDEFYRLYQYAKKKKIKFLSAPFDVESAYFLKKIGLKSIKIPSGEITNIPLLEFLSKTKLKLILSTGMSTLEEIDNAVKILKKNSLSILHCNSAYPTPFEDLNLRVIKFFLKKYKFAKIGFSDHSTGLEAGIAAATLGAQIIEKHFTVNKKLSGPDHKISLDPNELRLFVKQIRDVSVMLGSFNKKITNSEKNNIIPARKSIYAKKDIKKGEKFSELNLTIKRPQAGLKASNWKKIIKKKSNYNFKKNQLIKV